MNAPEHEKHLHRDAETERLDEDVAREKNWKRWGPYLAERQWGTVREDYSGDGSCWEYFSHDHARSRAYRWGEDGLFGISDREGRLCFALALWNGRDPFLKERLFGLTGPQGNHGEDVKEAYFYLDATPTHSYLRGLYKYPQAEFPYARLLEENKRRGRTEPEFELADTGVFDAGRYFDVEVEYAKAAPDDILIRVRVWNRGPEAARCHVLPTLWFRNTWSWGREGDEYWPKPSLTANGPRSVRADHSTLGAFQLDAEPMADSGWSPKGLPELLFTENETHSERIFGTAGEPGHFKDAFHDYVVSGRAEAVDPAQRGTKAALHYPTIISAGGCLTLRLRLHAVAESPVGSAPSAPFGPAFDALVDQRRAEADEYFARRIPAGTSDEARSVIRQAYAGLLWSKQFFYYVVKEWLEGDPAQPAPPPERALGRNRDWVHLHCRDILSMPDTWEYPWFAAWDLAFHMIPLAEIDPHYAKEQLVLFLREWYMHPNGQIPAYEWAFSDVNPPVHAWAAWRVYKMTGPRGGRDRLFLSRVFHKLLMNFTWWVNRKDVEGKHIFSGGFLGLDNIGVFDRSRPLPTGGHLEQADGTAWMAFYCSTLLSMAFELAHDNPAYEDVASKFFEHFVAISDAMNTLGGSGLWDEEDGFYYDQLHVDGKTIPLKIRSMVGLIPLFAVEVLEEQWIERLPGFRRRMRWFLEHRQDLARHISVREEGSNEGSDAASQSASQSISLSFSQPAPHKLRLLAIPSRERLERVLRYLLDEEEFLSPFGIRSLSRVHKDKPFVFEAQGQQYRVEYQPGESTSAMFGGNSNWRGPIWFPLNFLLIEALERYHRFYGDSLRVECPTGSGQLMNLGEVSVELSRRLARLFLRDESGHRPCHGGAAEFAQDPHWRDLLLFHEYFHGDTGKGLGASHQTGWTALAIRVLEGSSDVADSDAARGAASSQDPTAELTTDPGARTPAAPVPTHGAAVLDPAAIDAALREIEEGASRKPRD